MNLTTLFRRASLQNFSSIQNISNVIFVGKIELNTLCIYRSYLLDFFPLYRYKVKCAGDFLLSYSFITHELEPEAASCPGGICVDYVKVAVSGAGPTQSSITCGTVGSEIQLNGEQELNVEFFANRHTQDKGFLLYAWCSAPGTVLPPDPPPEKRRRTTERVECTTIPGDERIYPDPDVELVRILHQWPFCFVLWEPNMRHNYICE